MTDSPNQRPASDVDTQVGQAWSLHYHGKDNEAIAAYKTILGKWPEHIDANYGMALALKSARQTQEAGDAFRKTKDLISTALTTQGDDSVRNQMLIRMVDQHLSTL